MEISIVIPCLNEVDTIEKIIQIASIAARKYFKNKFEIIVSDNGSTDGTLTKLLHMKGIKLVKAPIKGYGGALHYGILSANKSYIFFADADLSYDFMELNKFLSFIKDGYDLILGSRIKGEIKPGAMPMINRYIGTPILTHLIRFIYKINTTDCNSGMRAIKKSFYRRLMMKNSGMEWASELIIKTAINKGRYAEVPITFLKDQRRNNPHLRRWEDGWRHLKVIILLRPQSLIAMAVLMVAIGVLFLPFSLFTTIAVFLFAEFLILSFLAVVKLDAAITKIPNRINNILDKLPLVFTGVVLTIFGILQLFLISDQHLFTKYILFYQMVLLDLWLFFIETIKTHLVNPLPINT